MTTYMMCSRSVENGTKNYWAVNCETEGDAFRQRKLAQLRVGNRFVVSFFRANVEQADATPLAEAKERVEAAREAATNSVPMAEFLAMTKKAQAAFIGEGGRVQS